MMMGGSKNNVKTMVLILVVLGLVALEQTKQVEAYICCCPVGGPIGLYWTCRAFAGIAKCCPVCIGHLSDDECEDGHFDPDIPGVRAQEKTAVDYCKLGCTSSMCHKLTSSVVGRSAEAKEAMERCPIACQDLCTKEYAEITKVSDI